MNSVEINMTGDSRFDSGVWYVNGDKIVEIMNSKWGRMFIMVERVDGSRCSRTCRKDRLYRRA